MYYINRLLKIIVIYSITYISASSIAYAVEVLSIGGVFIDICIQCENEQEFQELTESLGVDRGGSVTISHEKAQMLMEKIEKIPSERVTKCAGGISANTAAGIVSLGGKAGFVGAVGDRDDHAKLFLRAMGEVESLLVPIYDTHEKTGVAFAFITHHDDKVERTFAICPGVASKIYEIDMHLFNKCFSKSQSQIIFSEGVIWYNEDEEKTFIKSMFSKFRAQGSKIALSLSSSLLVENYSMVFCNLLPDIDILFGNEREIKALFQTNDLEYAKTKLGEWAGLGKGERLALITRSAEGVIIVTNKERIHLPAERNINVLDVAGASSAFAAGFLYGYTHELSLVKSARLGCKLAAEVIQGIGARCNKKMNHLPKTILGHDE